MATQNPCKDPSIEPCPPCCPAIFKLNTSTLALVPSGSTFVPRPSSPPAVNGGAFAVEPVNGGNGGGGMSTTTMLAIAAVLAAGGVALWLYKS